jgi:hypothetical protein
MRNGRVQGPDDRLDPLPQPVREVAGGFLVLAGRADEGQFQAGAGEERFGVLAGQALAGDDGGAGRRPVGRLILQHRAGGFPLAGQLGVGQGEPGHGPIAGHDEQQLASPVPAGMAGAVPIAGVPEQIRALGGDDGLAAGHRGGVHQPQQLRAAGRLPGQPPQRRLHQRRGRLEAVVVLALAQQPGEQVPDPGRCGAQPVPLVVITQQHLRHRQADQLRVGHLRRAAQPAAGLTQRRDDPVGQLHVECDQESVQVGDHEDLQGQTCGNTPILGTLHLPVNRSPAARRRVNLTATDFPVNDLESSASP